MSRKLIYLIIALYFLSWGVFAKIIEVAPADARMTTIIVGGGVAAAGGDCGTSDGTLVNMDMEETGTPVFDPVLEILGSPNFDYASSSTTSAPAKMCNEVMLSSGSGASGVCLEYNHGSALDGSCVRFYLYVDSYTLGESNEVAVMTAGASTDKWSSVTYRVAILETEGSLKLKVNSDTNSNLATISIDTWYYVDVCADGAGGAGLFHVDGVDYTGSFNTADYDQQYFNFGYAYLYAEGEAADVIIDAIAIQADGTAFDGVIGE